MTQGFDDYLDINYNENLDDLTKLLIHDAYKAGAASRQVEINGLNALNEISEQRIDNLVLRNIELQKRIDDALKYIGSGCGGSLDPVTKLNIILKGESNE